MVWSYYSYGTPVYSAWFLLKNLLSLYETPCLILTCLLSLFLYHALLYWTCVSFGEPIILMVHFFTLWWAFSPSDELISPSVELVILLVNLCILLKYPLLLLDYLYILNVIFCLVPSEKLGILNAIIPGVFLWPVFDKEIPIAFYVIMGFSHIKVEFINFGSIQIWGGNAGPAGFPYG